MLADNKNHSIRLNRVIRKTSVEGFGTRYCIWMQGCSIRCKGCLNQHMWNPLGGFLINVHDLVDDILQTKGIEGITILGGEPFDQIASLLLLLSGVSGKGLSVIVFSGHTIQEIQNNQDVLFRKCLEYVDVLIDGPFVEERKEFSRPWIGSDNQNYYFLSNRYSKEDLYSSEYSNKYEVRIDMHGRIQVNGMGRLDLLEKVLMLRGDEKIYGADKNYNFS